MKVERLSTKFIKMQKLLNIKWRLIFHFELKGRTREIIYFQLHKQNWYLQIWFTISTFFQDFPLQVLTGVVLLALAAVTTCSKPSNDLLCTICLDIVTDIDSWITSDSTEDQIVDWFHAICEVGNLRE